MIGKDDSMQNLGIIPCAISWLFKLINERKEKTGARFSVRISAVEVWGKEENLRDLLAEVATGSLQDGQSPGVYLCEDPICGTQVSGSRPGRMTPRDAGRLAGVYFKVGRTSGPPAAQPATHQPQYLYLESHGKRAGAEMVVALRGEGD